jgi:hypothetical protein
MKNLLLLLFLAIAASGYSQDVFYNSSIITLNGDTIKGFISNSYDSKTILFKRKKDDKPTIYSPKQLKGFILDGNRFVTKIANLPFYAYQNATDGISLFVKVAEKGIKHDTVFMHQIINGRVNLYKLKALNGLKYYFAEKYDIMKEIPPKHNLIVFDSSQYSRVPNMSEMLSTRYINYEITQYLDTLAYFLEDKSLLTTKKKLKYSENNIAYTIKEYNKKNGIKNGGILKDEIKRKWFTGLSVGQLYLTYDNIIEKSQPTSTFAFRAFGLLPLSGINRNTSLKVGLNYFTYQNEIFQRKITSGSVGLRYSSVSGIVRPYIEGSISIALQVRNGSSSSIESPFLAEVGAIIPIKDIFATIGITVSPILLTKLNGYTFLALNVGVMF